jgi:uncharacterized membrane protein
LGKGRLFMDGYFMLVAAVTAVLGLAVGRYAGRRGLFVASIAVLAGTAYALAGHFGGTAYVLLVILNLAIFEVIAVSMMLFRPALP